MCAVGVEESGRIIRIAVVDTHKLFAETRTCPFYKSSGVAASVVGCVERHGADTLADAVFGDWARWVMSRMEGVGDIAWFSRTKVGSV